MKPVTSQRTYYLAIAAAVAITLIIFTIAQLLSDENNKWFIKENGLIETLSAIGYFVCIGIMWKLGGTDYLKKYWYFAVVFAAFASRELDFDKRFTEVGVLKSRFLMSPDVSLMTKVISYTILAFILYALFKIIKNHGKAYLSKVFSFQFTPIVLSVSFAGAFLVISKTLDGLARKLLSLEIEISQNANSMASNMEEAMEFAVPLFFIIAVMAYVNEKRRA